MTAPAEAWSRGPAAALQYQNCVVRFLLGPWIPELIRSVAPAPGERVLDLACGTGAVTRAAAQCVGVTGTVCGLDLDPTMLAVAREFSHDTATNIQWELGDAVCLPFANARFDVVLCQQGLQFFSDRVATLREIRRVLSSRGRAALAVWGRIEKNPYSLAIAKAAGRRIGDDVGQQLRTPFALGVATEFRNLLASAGFKAVQLRLVSMKLNLPPLTEFIQEHLAATSLAPVFASMDPKTRSAMIAEIVSELRCSPAQGVQLPFEIQLAVLR